MYLQTLIIFYCHIYKNKYFHDIKCNKFLLTSFRLNQSFFLSDLMISMYRKLKFQLKRRKWQFIINILNVKNLMKMKKN